MRTNFVENVMNYFYENRNEILLGYIAMTSLSSVGTVREALRK